MLSDQQLIISRGIPTEVALILLAIVVFAVAAIFVAGRRADGGERLLRGASVLLCLVGLAVAGYVFFKIEVEGQQLQCIGGGSGCVVVELSQYSRLAGVHMSTLGLIGYLAVLGSLWIPGDRGRLVTLGLTGFGFLFSLYLTYLELWKILAICQWCVISAITMTVLFLIAAMRVWRHFGLDDYEDDAAKA